jgi:hypothetical protein
MGSSSNTVINRTTVFLELLSALFCPLGLCLVWGPYFSSFLLSSQRLLSTSSHELIVIG